MLRETIFAAEFLSTKYTGRRGFTDQYNAVRLVYWERYDDVHKAIAREKQLKRWRREKSCG